MSKDKSIPAFPENDNGHNGGMSLRDYFAAKAMAATLAAAHSQEWSFDGFESFDEMIAHQSYEMADAMLKEREGK